MSAFLPLAVALVEHSICWKRIAGPACFHPASWAAALCWCRRCRWVFANVPVLAQTCLKIPHGRCIHQLPTQRVGYLPTNRLWTELWILDSLLILFDWNVSTVFRLSLQRKAQWIFWKSPQNISLSNQMCLWNSCPAFFLLLDHQRSSSEIS